MKQTSSLPNEGIDDTNVAYTTKMEGYATFMSDMKELYAMPFNNKLERYINAKDIC
jgi:hypothetical protein